MRIGLLTGVLSLIAVLHVRGLASVLDEPIAAHSGLNSVRDTYRPLVTIRDLVRNPMPFNRRHDVHQKSRRYLASLGLTLEMTDEQLELFRTNPADVKFVALAKIELHAQTYRNAKNVLSDLESIDLFTVLDFERYLDEQATIPKARRHRPLPGIGPATINAIEAAIANYVNSQAPRYDVSTANLSTEVRADLRMAGLSDVFSERELLHSGLGLARITRIARDLRLCGLLLEARD